jgi:IclR family transcriptional regulator, KDG regulon repressor
MDLHPADVRLPAVERTVDLIQLLSHSNRGLTLAEISQAIGIPKSSAHYLIQTLLARGFLLRNSDCRTYSIGLRLPEFVKLSPAVQELRNVLRDDLWELARVTSLTTVATILRDIQAVVIEKVNPRAKEPKGSVQNWVARHIDAHCTAQGKIHLAYLREVELEDLFRGYSLPRFTPNTICSMTSLKAHLAKVRSDGFALNDQEHIVGVRGIAAPVFSHTGHTIAAFGVTGPVEEISRDRISAIVERVVSAALECSKRLLEWVPRGYNLNPAHLIKAESHRSRAITGVDRTRAISG